MRDIERSIRAARERIADIEAVLAAEQAELNRMRAQMVDQLLARDRWRQELRRLERARDLVAAL